MKNTFKITAVILILFAVSFACKKSSKEPAQTCKTCIARDKLEGAPVANEQVCSDEAEDNFRSVHSEHNVTCE